MAAYSSDRAPIITWAHQGYWGRAPADSGKHAADLRFLHRLTTRQIEAVLSEICLAAELGGGVRIPDRNEALASETEWLPIRANASVEADDRRVGLIRRAVALIGLTASRFDLMDDSPAVVGDVGAPIFDTAAHLGVTRPGRLLSFGLVLCEPAFSGLDSYPPMRVRPEGGEIADLVRFYPDA